MSRKGITRKKVGICLDAELFELVSPYIQNLSAYFNRCLQNYYNTNKKIIDSDSGRTSKYLLDDTCYGEEEIENLPNITYIIENAPVQLKLFEIVNGRVIAPNVFEPEKAKTIIYPCIDKLDFKSNNTCKYRDKDYFFIIDDGYYQETDNAFQWKLNQLIARKDRDDENRKLEAQQIMAELKKEHGTSHTPEEEPNKFEGNHNVNPWETY